MSKSNRAYLVEANGDHLRAMARAAKAAREAADPEGTRAKRRAQYQAKKEREEVAAREARCASARKAAATPSTVAATSATLVASTVVATGAGREVEFHELDLRLEAGDVLAFTVQTASSTAVTALSLTWSEI